MGEWRGEEGGNEEKGEEKEGEGRSTYRILRIVWARGREVQELLVCVYVGEFESTALYVKD